MFVTSINRLDSLYLESEPKSCVLYSYYDNTWISTGAIVKNLASNVNLSYYMEL